MIYIDTSVAVAAVTRESHSPRVWQWLEAHATTPLFFSGWVEAEVSSALSVKVRTGALNLSERVDALQSWRSLRDGSLAELVVMPEHFTQAGRFCDQPNLGLRASDALHLAIAAHANTPLATLDARLYDAAIQLGIAVEAI